MPLHYIYLFLAIVTEVIGTSALQASTQFTRFWPSALVVVANSASFYFMTFALKLMPITPFTQYGQGWALFLSPSSGCFGFAEALIPLPLSASG